LRLLELFSGTESMSKAFRANGWEVLTVDNSSDFKPNINIDILKIDLQRFIDFNQDVIWASPPCTAFSVASIGTHWKHGKPSKQAILGTALLCKTIEIIMVTRPKYWFIENPRGMMRKLPIMDLLPKNTVTYCQYGDKRMKPTDIWNNCDIWEPKPPCRNGDTCHVSAPRGSRTGTQGVKGAVDRSRIPKQLCGEIAKVVKK